MRLGFQSLLWRWSYSLLRVLGKLGKGIYLFIRQNSWAYSVPDTALRSVISGHGPILQEFMILGGGGADIRLVECVKRGGCMGYNGTMCSLGGGQSVGMTGSWYSNSGRSQTRQNLGDWDKDFVFHSKSNRKHRA